MQQVLLPGGQIQDGHADNAVQVAVHFLDIGLQFLPEYFFFFPSCLLRARWGRRAQADGNESKGNPP